MNEFGKIGPFFDYGGLKLLNLRAIDKLRGTTFGNDYMYKIAENADSSEYPRLLKDMYKIAMGESLNLDNPRSFCEKIQWMKLYDSTALKTRLADKYLVRDWISEKIGEQYLVPLLGVWDSFDEIDFDSLPDAFALKCNHGSGMNVVTTNKGELALSSIKNRFEDWMNYNFAFQSFELQYLTINHKIIAEKYIEQMDGNLLDYKVHCFNGEPIFMQVIGDRDIVNHTGKQDNYDFSWERLPWILEDYPSFGRMLERPEKLDELYEISKTLSQGFSYVRVDLYLVEDKIQFGEMTFTPASGFYPYMGTWTKEMDDKYGSMIDINIK